MKENKLEKLVKDAKESSWKDDIKYLIDNEAWLDKSADIALAILDRLDDLKMSKAELARRMGVSRQYVNKIVKGQENLTLEQIAKIEQALGLELIQIPEYYKEEGNEMRFSTEMTEAVLQIASLEFAHEEILDASYKSHVKPKKEKSSANTNSSKVSAGESNYGLAA